MIMKNNNVKPHIVIVGASGGIGYALTQKLLNKNKLTLITRRTEKFLNIKTKDINIVKFDVLKFDQISKTLEKVVKTNGKINSLVYCVGFQLVKPLRNFRVSEIKKIIDTNLTSTLFFAKEMASNSISDANSIFCAISSTAASNPEPAIIPYSVSKAGLETMIKGLSIEIPSRLFVGVAPGWLDTEMTKSFSHIYDQKFKEELKKKSPKGIPTVDTVADLIKNLILKKTKFINGEIIKLDGGLSK